MESSLSRSVYSGNGMGQHYVDPEHLVVRRAVELVHDTEATSVLDIACGRGLISLAVANETEAKAITAFDINEPAIQELNETATKQSLPIRGIVFDAASKKGYAEALCPPESVEIVIAKDVFPFLSPIENQTMLDNINHILHPNGWLLLTAPSTRSRLYQESEPTENPLYRKIGEAAKEYIQTDLDYFTFTTIRDMAHLLQEYDVELVEASHYGRASGWIMAVGQKHAEKSAKPTS